MERLYSYSLNGVTYDQLLKRYKAIESVVTYGYDTVTDNNVIYAVKIYASQAVVHLQSATIKRILANGDNAIRDNEGIVIAFLYVCREYGSALIEG